MKADISDHNSPFPDLRSSSAPWRGSVFPRNFALRHEFGQRLALLYRNQNGGTLRESNAPVSASIVIDFVRPRSS